jgi:LPXTG-site transpeptidase (sortase) family protein
MTPAALAAVALAAAGCGAAEPPAPPEPVVAERPRAAPERGAAERAARPRPAPERGAAERAAAPRRTADVARPRRVEIPAIGVSAPVIALGLRRDGTLEVPRDYGDTGWWTGGPEPGERGAAVIAGHVDSKSGPAVFHRLDELERGDEIRVHRRDGSVGRFVVRGSERHPKARFPTRRVYGRTPGPTLRLVTCSGDFDTATGHYTDNTIVFADAAPGARRG